MPGRTEQCWEAISRERHSSYDTEQSSAGILFLCFTANWYIPEEKEIASFISLNIQ